MIIDRSHILLKLCMLLLLLEAATSQGTSATPAASAATTVPGASTDPPTAATNAGTSDGTTENTTLCITKNYDFLCNLEELPMIALLVAPGVGLLLIAVVIAVACRVCGGKSDDDDEIFMERERTSQIAMNDYRSNMAASSVVGEDDFSGRQKTNPAYMEDDEVAFNHNQRNFGRPSVSSGSDRMDNRRQRMSMASVDRPYGEDHRRPGSHYPDDDMRHPPGRPTQYGDDPRRAGSRYMEEDPRRPPPDSRGRPYGHPGDRDDGRRPLASSPMYDKSEQRGGPRPQQPQQSSAGGRRNWAKQSSAPHDVPPADYDDGFPNPRSSYAGFNRQDVSNYY